MELLNNCELGYRIKNEKNEKKIFYEILWKIVILGNKIGYMNEIKF